MKSTAFRLLLVSTYLFLQPSVQAKSQIYFSPDGGARDAILRQINLTRKTIDLAIFDFTAGPVALAIHEAAKRGVKIRIVADRRQAGGKNSEVPYLMEMGVPLKILAGKGRGIMHHKFAIFDGQVMVTGSYNWTENAERFNYENLLVEDDPALIQAFQKEFEKLWSRGNEVPTDKQKKHAAQSHEFDTMMNEWLRSIRRFLNTTP